jgi:hypothetical protein
MKCIMFDVDGTMAVSQQGPIPMDFIYYLGERHCIGICGNWAAAYLSTNIKDFKRFTFVDTASTSKAAHLAAIKKFCMFEEYIFVGNAESDKAAADEAGWKFVWAKDWKDLSG